MLDKNDLEAIAQLMDSKLTPINGRLDRMEGRLERMETRLDRMETRLDRMETRLDQVQEDIESLKEDSAINRNGVNTLLEWAEKAQVQVQIPLFKKAE
ncbi:hypothetical protein [Hydrogeniiclostridium mannosilyticum]|uniref:hypothetical protein n=1 Tax=Hydrogeniiclostridium mannosilyticum TaxID=2764322 RepID=UPI0015B1D790|nr:hypothetical protein [Hydrogeniiclostridium mannosilyticum]